MMYPTIYHAGEERALSLHPRDEAINGVFDVGKIPCSAVDGGVIPAWGTSEKCPIIPEAKWTDRRAPRHLFTRILNQGSLNYCHSFASVAALQGRRKGDGQSDVELSAVALGSKVTGGRNTGAALSDVMPVIMGWGVPPASLVPNDAKYYTGRGWPTGVDAAAGELVVLEAYDIGQEDVFQQIASAIQSDMFVAFGMDWGRGGHALCACGLFKQSGEWNLEGIGSWGPTAHDGDGWWHFAKGDIGGLSKYGCFAIRVGRRASFDPVAPAIKA